MTGSTKAGIFEYLDLTIVRVSNIDISKKWYEEILELKPIFFDQAEKLVAYYAGNNIGFAIWQTKPGDTLIPASLAGSFPIFFANDIHQTHETLTDRGVKVEKIQGSQYVKFFGFFDPDNNRLEVCNYTQ